MPSGHATLAIVLLEYIVRFFARVNQSVKSNIIWFYLLIAFFQSLVIFSRIILGMHSFNQVMFGSIIGLYSMVVYYLFMENLILKWILSIFKNQKQSLTFIILVSMALTSLSISVLILVLQTYNNQKYIDIITNIKGCEGY